MMKAHDEIQDCLPQHVVSYAGIARDYLESVVFNLPITVDPKEPIYKLMEEKLDTLVHADGNLVVTGGDAGTLITGQIKEKINTIGTTYLKDLKDMLITKLGDEQRIYIPILRGLRTLPLLTPVRKYQNNADSVFYNATLRDYFCEDRNSEISPKGFNHHSIFTGEDFYRNLRYMLLGEPEERSRVKEYEDFLSNHFFEGRQVTLIPREHDDVVHILIGNEKQLPIYALGDGLQTLIICTFKAFMNDDRCLFFIEEPDTYMHPGIQRALITAFKQRPLHQYYITTHSNHLLDMTLDFSDISVFRFQKTECGESPEFSIENVTSSDRNILIDLGVKNSSVFLTNATVWVEGISDRLYLRTYINKYLEELRETDTEKYNSYSTLQEDIHFSFVEYQGSNLDHWTFDEDDESIKRIKATYLCGDAIVIADGDVTDKGNRAEFFEECLKERFIVLPCKEIENLLPEEILRFIVKKKFEDNGGDIEKISYSEYSTLCDQGIGHYLDSKLETEELIFSERSGTIKSKQAYCRKAIKLMNDINIQWSLSEEHRNLCDAVLNHIASMNDM
jgi:hypothetical protein